MTEEKQKKAGWFSKIRSREDAIKVARDCAMGFFVVAAIQAALALWLDLWIFFDAAVYVACGFFIRRFYSRTAAVIALLLSSVSLVITFMNKAGAAVGGGNNIILALIVAWAAVRAVEATFKLHGRFKDAGRVEQQSAPPA